MPHNDPEKRRRYQREYFASHKKMRGGGADAVAKSEKKTLVNMRLSVMLVGRLTAIVNQANADGRYPWKTRTAAVEALLVRGLETMKSDPFIAQQLELIEATEDIQRLAQHRTEAQALLSRMRTEINELMAIRATHHALTVYCNCRDNIEDISPNVWRDWLLESLKKAYPQLERESASVDVAFKVKGKKEKPKQKDGGRDHDRHDRKRRTAR